MQVGPSDQLQTWAGHRQLPLLSRRPSCTPGGAWTEHATLRTEREATARPEPTGVAASQAMKLSAPTGSGATPLHQAGTSGWEHQMAKQVGEPPAARGQGEQEANVGPNRTDPADRQHRNEPRPADRHPRPQSTPTRRPQPTSPHHGEGRMRGEAEESLTTCLPRVPWLCDDF